MEKVYISVAEGLGYCWGVFANEKAVTGIYPLTSHILTNDNPISTNAANQICEYFINIRSEFDFPVEPCGTPFQKQVWDALRAIPYGCVVSYSDIAAQIGRPKAVRAVGQAVGRNPCLIAIPCHRVLGKNGRLTGFSAGLDIKKQLLLLEGVSHYE